MPKEIITLEDLQDFKRELISEISMLLGKAPANDRRWLKSYQVREILGISSGTLQHMRTTGKIRYSKVGGLALYDQNDVYAMMDAMKR